MKNSELFRSIDQDGMMDINGGGFAYDVGRVIRFVILSATPILGMEAAIADWQLNKEISDIING
jgi:hypothetical protein